MNADMQGYIVRLSNFITHVGAAIFVAWSADSPRSAYKLLLGQIFVMFIAMLVAVKRNQLSIDDAHFAVILTRSPLCIYCMLLVLPRLFVTALAGKASNTVRNLGLLWTQPALAWTGLQTDLYSRAVFDGCFGALVLTLCLVLNVSVRLNGHLKFYSAVQCGVEDCWGPHVDPDPSIVYRWSALFIISFPTYECVLARHQKLRWKLMGILAGHPSIRKLIYGKCGICGFFATWYIAVKLHPWIPFLYAVIWFHDWSRKLNLLTVEADFELSYGQFLAIAPAVLVTWQCLGLAMERRSDIWTIPALFLRDVVWILTGKGESWGAEEVEVENIWKLFPADEVVDEPGLPSQQPRDQPSATPSPRGLRRREQRAPNKRAPDVVMLPEVDLGQDISLQTLEDAIVALGQQ
ncbi:hypothetical protein B0H16DRAFT_998603 [Mycena metata]|uniref:Uncharacterized protein n=1 Tax=Mycena metata TaxID=1033252 RepID=A0AAD7IKG1_9AGAR|nr:hypothetical protein B0H16DRAFT_998603 [Mycena metata]